MDALFNFGGGCTRGRPLPTETFCRNFFSRLLFVSDPPFRFVQTKKRFETGVAFVLFCACCCGSEKILCTTYIPSEASAQRARTLSMCLCSFAFFQGACFALCSGALVCEGCAAVDKAYLLTFQQQPQVGIGRSEVGAKVREAEQWPSADSFAFYWHTFEIYKRKQEEKK